jgi:hypothetical protein
LDNSGQGIKDSLTCIHRDSPFRENRREMLLCFLHGSIRNEKLRSHRVFEEKRSRTNSQDGPNQNVRVEDEYFTGGHDPRSEAP